MSLLTATQITAIATAILAIGAFTTSILAGFALYRQSQEVTLLQQQAKRDIDERRRAQAAKVYLQVYTQAPVDVVRVDRNHKRRRRLLRHHPPNPEPLHLLFIAKVTNASNLPIYKVAIIWFPGQLSSAKSMPTLIPANDLPSGLPRLMPGKAYEFKREAYSKFSLKKYSPTAAR